MNLEKTRALMHAGISKDDPRGSLVSVLRATFELLSLPENDFGWSSWEDASEAIRDIELIIHAVEAGELPEQPTVARLFAPTGPIQEVSLSGGWADTFLRVAEKFDEVQALLW